MASEDNVLRELIGEISSLISEYPKALERRASLIQAGGKDPELVE